MTGDPVTVAVLEGNLCEGKRTGKLSSDEPVQVYDAGGWHRLAGTLDVMKCPCTASYS